MKKTGGLQNFSWFNTDVMSDVYMLGSCKCYCTPPYQTIHVHAYKKVKKTYEHRWIPLMKMEWSK